MKMKVTMARVIVDPKDATKDKMLPLHEVSKLYKEGKLGWSIDNQCHIVMPGKATELPF